MELIATWLPPAAIIAVILFTSNQLNKRINDSNKRTDDLRREMNNDFAILRRQMALSEKRLSEQLDSIK